MNCTKVMILRKHIESYQIEEIYWNFPPEWFNCCTFNSDRPHIVKVSQVRCFWEGHVVFIEFQCLHISPTFQIIRLVRPSGDQANTEIAPHRHADMQAWPGLGDGRAHSLKASVPHSFPVGSSHLTNQTKADRRRNRRKIVILCVFNKGSSYVDYYLVDDLKYFSAGYIHGSGRGKWKWQGADWRRVMGKL